MSVILTQKEVMWPVELWLHHLDVIIVTVWVKCGESRGPRAEDVWTESLTHSAVTLSGAFKLVMSLLHFCMTTRSNHKLGYVQSQQVHS